SGYDRNSACDRLDCIADHVKMLFMSQCRRFSGRTADNDSIRLIRDLLFQKLSKLIIIYFAIVIHRGNDRYTCAFKNSHNSPPLVKIKELSKAAPKESLNTFSSDSPPSQRDDSHMVLHHMPKITEHGSALFRRSPLSSAITCGR